MQDLFNKVKIKSVVKITTILGLDHDKNKKKTHSINIRDLITIKLKFYK